MKRKTVAMQGAKGMEKVVERLQRVCGELDEAASYFEAIGMETQANQLDDAHQKTLDVQELLECLLGRVDLHITVGLTSTSPTKRKAKASKKPHLLQSSGSASKRAAA